MNLDHLGTVGQMKALLEDMDVDMPLVFKFPSGDYWRTNLARPVDQVDVGVIEYSEYHQSAKIVEDADGYSPEDIEEGKQVRAVILS